MTVFIVTYDLKKPGQSYEPLWKRLAAWKAVRALESTWFISTTSSAVELRDDLKRYVDENDRLFVGALGACAWHNIMGNSGDVLRQRAAA
jgi:hypothetical protein